MKPHEDKEHYAFNHEVVELKTIAALHKLKVLIEEPIHPTDPVIPIINLRRHTMNIVARKIFLEEQCPKGQSFIEWADDVVGLPSPTDPRELDALKQVRSTPKGLLQTSAGLALTNLKEVKAGTYVSDYAGELVIRYSNPRKRLNSQAQPIFRLLDMGSTPGTSPAYTQNLYPPECSSNFLESAIYAQTYRGFGAYVQHLYTPEELNDLYVLPKKHTVVTATIELEDFPYRLFYKATDTLPPFTLFGDSYGGNYWFGEEKDPILFDKDGFKIDSQFPIRNYRVRIRNSCNDFTEIKGSLKEVTKPMSIPLQASSGVVYKKAHFQHFYDSKKKCYRLPRIFNEIYADEITADEYLTVGFKLSQAIRSPEYAHFSPQQKIVEYQYIINIYKQVTALLPKEAKQNQEKMSVCVQSIKNMLDMIKELKSSLVQPRQSQASVATPPPGVSTSVVAQRAAPPRKTPSQAIAEGDLVLLSQLLTVSQVNVQDSKGQTLLHEAVCGGKLFICAYLLTAKANPQIIDHRQKKPIDYVSANSNHLIWRMLLQTDSHLFNNETYPSCLDLS